ncbi:MAG TPA: hydantoinase B/oxoprolinase family protein [Dehalococcoidales bacterium]|nr:hydantoinase B/oxoprolinase family protein [Dehalococcoidales bacterium]
MRPDPLKLLAWIKPSPPTEDELEAMKLLQPGDFEIYTEKLNNFLLESKEVFLKLGVSSMLRSGDLVTGIYTPTGNMVAAWCGTYLHAVVGQLPIKYVAETWLDEPTVGIKDGDIFYVSDPLYGGIHNCDQIVVMPVFNDGELIAWTNAAVHQPETGACEPGGMPLSAKTRHDEGMLLSPIKIGENFRFREDLVEMCVNLMSRAPRMQAIDMRARLSAADRLRTRLVSLAQEKGNDFVKGLFRRVLIESEEGTRRRIRQYNDGSYRAVTFMDIVGEKHKLVRNFLTLTKKDDKLIWDFTGTSPETDSPQHCMPHSLAANVAIHLMSYTFADLPVSAGIFAPMEWIVPEGCMFNPNYEAAQSNSAPSSHGAMTLGTIVMSKMMFESPQRDLVAAATGNTGVGIIIAGENQWGVPVADFLAFGLNTEGHGARSDLDGVDAYGFSHCPTGRAPDIEDIENEFQFLNLMAKLSKDSCGFGKHRGGCGTEAVIAVNYVPWALYNSHVKGSKVRNCIGLFGGYPPATLPGIEVLHNDLWEKMKRGDKDLPSNAMQLISERSIHGDYKIGSMFQKTHIMNNGDLWVVFSGGGGGYGDVLERDPEMVMDDLRREIISRHTAENVYHVAFDPETLEVDHEKTGELRNREREDRKARGMTWEEFEKEWCPLHPSPEAMDYYGSWPEGRKEREIIRM